MYRITPNIILSLLCVLGPHTLWAQSPCEKSYAKVLGSLIDHEKGYSLAASPTDNILYLGGLRNDSVAILKINTDGLIEWSSTFDFIPGRADHIRGFIVDSEGMIVGSGGSEVPQNNSSVFAFRYDPLHGVMIWANEYRTTFDNLASGIHEVFSDGDFLMVNNPHEGTLNDAELLRLDRNTGQIVSSISEHIDIGGSESLGDFVLHEGFLYTTGRYTDGAPNSKMRTAITKIDPQNGIPVWTRLGHKSGTSTARLYGVDMVVDQDHIYSISLGNPTSTNINASEVYIQKMDLDGDWVWIRQYDLPGSTDWVDEIVSTGDGFIVFGRNRLPPSDIYLFKIDHDGDVMWSKKFDFSDNDNSVTIGGVQSQMLLLQESVFITAAADGNGQSDIILIRTTLEGEISDTCMGTSDILIPVHPVPNPVFYDRQPVLRSISPQIITLPLQNGNPIVIPAAVICENQDSKTSLQYIEVCEGDTIEGYGQTGQYIDTFPTSSGCDSIRTLQLTVIPSNAVTVMAQICPGQVFEGYTTAGVYTDTLIAANGCDSIRILYLEVASQIYSMVSDSICPGESYDGYTSTGVYLDTLISAFGCDSIRQLQLTVSQPEIYVDTEPCAGATFEGYDVAGTYTDTLFAIPGECDTIRYLTLTFLPPLQTEVMVTLCEGHQYDGYTLPGTYTDTLQTAEGCDSIRLLQLSVQPTPERHITVSSCEGKAYGYATPGTYMDTVMATSGCDTIRTLYIEGSSQYIPNAFSPNGDQINDVFEVYAYPNQDTGLRYFAIFDRFGDLVYETSAWPVRWDGRHLKSGRYYNPGVFTYVMITDCGASPHEAHGNITLIR